MLRRGLAGAATIAIALLAPEARANDPAAAQVLFDQAQKLMTQEHWAEACPKLEESQRLDPGGGTLLHLAACREHEGKTATAWAHYQDALESAKRDGRKDRAKLAQARIEALAPRLARLRIRVAAKVRKVAGLRVTRDDTTVGEALWDEPFPVDPGSHAIAASAEGFKPWTAGVEIPPGPGETAVDIPELEANAAPGSPPPAVTHVAVVTPASPEDTMRGGGQRTVGIVVGAVGVAGLLLGGVTGILALSKESDADAQCRPPDYVRCTPIGVATGKDAQTYGTMSTIGFVAGGALVAGGAILYLTAPRSRSARPNAGVTPLLGSGAAGLSFSGTFR